MNEPYGSVFLYHPKGMRVSFPLRGENATFMAQIDSLLSQGFLPREPGLEIGEERDDVGWVLHGSFSKDRQTTPYVLLYSTKEKLTYSFLKVYLNSAADVAEFEWASKMKLNAITEYDGSDKPERGVNPKIDAKYITRAPSPFGVVFKSNPKWNEDAKKAAEAEKKVYAVPRRVFVRWADQMPQNAHQNGTPAQSQQQSGDQSELAKWHKLVETKPSAIQINDTLPHLKDILHADTRKLAWGIVCKYCEQAGYSWNADAKQFSGPALAAAPSDGDPF